MVVPQRPPPAANDDIPGYPDLPVVTLAGRIEAPQIAAVCKRVRELICDQGANTVVVDVSGVIEPDMAALDALARLHLMARRFGRDLKIVHTCVQLEVLVAFSGLGGVLCVKGEGQPE